MSDETNLSLLVGQLQGGFREIRQMLIDQNAQHERDKNAAIARSSEQHSENQTEIRKAREAIDSTAAIAKDSAQWITEEGRPLVAKVKAIEDGTTIAAAEGRGRRAAFNMIYAVIGAGLTALGAVSSDMLDAARKLIHGG